MTTNWRGLAAAVMLGCPLLWAADDKSSAKSDQTFVTKAAQGGLAEVNHSNLATKQASDAEVVKFAKQMIADHTKANKELMKLADQKKLTVPKTMGDEHEKMQKKLAKLTGAEFDRAYIEGQVKDHKDTIALFEKQAKSGEDADLRQWAKDKLPALRDHLKMAQKVHDRLKGGKGGTKTADR